MDEMRIYIANLGKYNEGELVGEWFVLPVDEEEVAERIGLNDEYEEYAIHDYELPFEIDEYTPLERLNDLAEMVSELPDEIKEVIPVLMSYFGDIEELCESADDIIHHSGCDSMDDVAYCYVNECGLLDGVSDVVSRYFDYAGYGRDLEMEGNFIGTKNGIFEINR